MLACPRSSKSIAGPVQGLELGDDITLLVPAVSLTMVHPESMSSDPYAGMMSCRYGSPGVLEQWIQQVERDVEELTEDTLSVGDIMDASLQR